MPRFWSSLFVRPYRDDGRGHRRRRAQPGAEVDIKRVPSWCPKRSPRPSHYKPTRRRRSPGSGIWRTTTPSSSGPARGSAAWSADGQFPRSGRRPLRAARSTGKVGAAFTSTATWHGAGNDAVHDHHQPAAFRPDHRRLALQPSGPDAAGRGGRRRAPRRDDHRRRRRQPPSERDRTSPARAIRGRTGRQDRRQAVRLGLSGGAARAAPSHLQRSTSMSMSLPSPPSPGASPAAIFLMSGLAKLADPAATAAAVGSTGLPMPQPRLGCDGGRDRRQRGADHGFQTRLAAFGLAGSRSRGAAVPFRLRRPDAGDPVHEERRDRRRSSAGRGLRRRGVQPRRVRRAVRPPN